MLDFRESLIHVLNSVLGSKQKSDWLDMASITGVNIEIT